MDFYRYKTDLDIHYIDYSGRIDLKEGLTRIAFLEKCFQENSSNQKSLKILMDARGYIKACPETHDKLAKISHQKFDTEMGGVRKYTAVLNDQYDFKKSDIEQWFTDEKAAIEWLLNQESNSVFSG